MAWRGHSPSPRPPSCSRAAASSGGRSAACRVLRLSREISRERARRQLAPSGGGGRVRRPGAYWVPVAIMPDGPLNPVPRGTAPAGGGPLLRTGSCRPDGTRSATSPSCRLRASRAAARTGTILRRRACLCRPSPAAAAPPVVLPQRELHRIRKDRSLAAFESSVSDRARGRWLWWSCRWPTGSCRHRRRRPSACRCRREAACSLGCSYRCRPSG